MSLNLATEMTKTDLLRQTYYFSICFFLIFEKYGICQLVTFRLRPFAIGSRTGAHRCPPSAAEGEQTPACHVADLCEEASTKRAGEHFEKYQYMASFFNVAI